MRLKEEEMICHRYVMRLAICSLPAVLFLVAAWVPATAAQDQLSSKDYGIAAKRPVLQAACRHCPWGALGDILQRIMAPTYDVAICYGCSGENAPRYVSKRLMSAEVSDRLFGQGVSTRPDAPVDFGITGAENVRNAFEGSGNYKKDGPFSNLRLIARIESPAYLMIAVVKSSGITDLRQIREKKIPVRIMLGPGGAMHETILEYYGITKKDVIEWGGTFLAGNALVKNPNFDVMLGSGVLSNYPEGNMWYEMSQKKDLVFLQIPEDLRHKLAKETRGELVTLPFRYLRGLDDEPHPTVGHSGLLVYGRDDLPDQFVRDVAKGLDEKRSLIKWANQPFSYDPNTVWKGDGVPLHPAAERYYRERGYIPAGTEEAR
jgi:TRAP transporter TAXI family solute receptor